tara:strand:- start:9922 stop:11310 length:1389 start_codon:yes stop_codon:yes gene_type:complete
MAILDELLVGLGFDYDPEDMKKFKKDITRTTGIIKKLSKHALVAASSLLVFQVATNKATDEQGKLSDEIGETIGMIDALQFATQIAGGSAQGMAESLRSLATKAGEAARGVGAGVEIFGLLGLSAIDANGEIKKASDILLEVSKRFKGLEKSRQVDLAEKLGLRDSIRLLQLGPQAIKDLVKEAKLLGVTTSKDAGVSAEFNDSLVRIWETIKQVSRVITRSLSPAMTEMNEKISTWWKENRKVIEQKLPEWIEKATTAMKLLVLATGFWISMKMVGHLISLITLFRSLSIAVLLANASVLLLPALITAAALALAGIAQDAKVFFEGGDSLFGSLIEKFPKFKNELQSVAAVFATLSDLTIMIFDGWGKIFDLFKTDISVKGINDTLGNIPGFLGDVSGLYTVGGGGAIPELGQSISKTASTTIDKVEIFVQGGVDTAENIANSVFDKFKQTAQDLRSAVDL